MKKIVFLLLLFPLWVYSQALPVSVPPFVLNSVGNVATVGSMTANAANAASLTFGPAANNAYFARGAAALAVPGAAPVVMSAAGGISKTAALGALGRFFGKVVPLLSVGVAVYDLAKELGYETQQDVAGHVVFYKRTGGTVCQSGCFNYSTIDRVGKVFAGFPSPESAAQSAYESSLVGTSGLTNHYLEMRGGVPPTGWALMYNPWGSPAEYFSRGIDKVPVPPWDTTTLVPASIPEVLQSIDDKNVASGWDPAQNTVGRAIADAIKSGESIDVVPQTLTGPAASPGPVSRTVDAVANTTTVTNTTNKYTYEGPNVTTTTVTNTQTTNNTTGAVTTNTTNEQTPAKDQTPDTANDTPLPDAPTLYKPKYPDGLVGVWNAKKAELLASPLLKVAGDLMPTVDAAGSCPTWMLPLDVGIANFGTWDVAPPCWVWGFAKLVVMIGAFILARALIFGG